MNKELEGFDWGVDDQYFIDIVKREILVENVYEFITEVKEGDIVVDIGASAGPFTRSILHKNPKHVYCVEPSKHFFPILEKNTEGYPVTIINKAIVDELHKKPLVFYDTSTVDEISFKTLIESYNIEKIDFLKIDCEGGEYSIFIDENKDYLFNNVKTIAAEFHCIHGPDGFKDSFRNFRDNFLVKFPSFKAYTPTTQLTKPGEAIDITDSIFDEWFIDNYWTEMMIYINNFK
jgi:FkbM family methyltransferase